MPRQAPELSEVSIRRLAHKTGKNGKPIKVAHAVGGVSGLYLQCFPPSGNNKRGSRQWILRATVGTKRREIGIGSYPSVPTKKARELAREARDKIKNGIDPIAEKAEAKAKLKALQSKDIRFEQYAKDVYIPLKSKEFKSAVSIRKLHNCGSQCYPIIGKLNFEDITVDHCLQILEPIWETKHELALQTRRFLEAVIARAMVQRLREKPNPALWVNNLKILLPDPKKVHTVKHHARIEPSELPAFWSALWNLDNPKRSRDDIYAFAVMVLTVGRKEEVARGDWQEIDLEKKVWVQPAGKYKSQKEWTVPLTPTVVKLFKAMGPKRKGRIFSSIQGEELGNQLTDLPRSLGFNAVAHGFRATFSRWAKDEQKYSVEVKDLCMKHLEQASTRAMYERDQGDTLLAVRRKMLCDYEKWVTKGE